jgi:hypothetical protein
VAGEAAGQGRTHGPEATTSISTNTSMVVGEEVGGQGGVVGGTAAAMAVAVVGGRHDPTLGGGGCGLQHPWGQPSPLDVAAGSTFVV